MLISKLMRGCLLSSIRTLLCEVSSPNYQITKHVSLNFRVKRGFCVYRLLDSNMKH
uniref:Uncharacterized protein n=1 Tax=Physcomitrium patens TaxID=3218 RepID=A0A2K1JKY8_PHYPA|nr:hypothetical protein PHYPA_017039 [Physcomitrium patens]